MSVSVNTLISVIIEAIDCKFCMMVSVYNTLLTTLLDATPSFSENRLLAFFLGYDSPSVYIL